MSPLDLVAILLTPVLAAALSVLFAGSPRARRVAVVLLVLLSAEYYYKDVCFTLYRGHSRGFSISLPDLITWGFTLMLLWHRPRGYERPMWWPRGTGAVLLFAVWGLASSLAAFDRLLAAFTVFKLFKAVVLFWTVANLMRDDEDLRLMTRATAFVLVWLGVEVLWHKYVQGIHVIRAQGPFSHSNTLVMWANLCIPMALATALTARSQGEALASGAAVYLGVVCVIFTKSRGGLAMLGLGLVGTLMLSYWNRVTARKGAVLALVLMGGVLTGAVAAPRLIARFQNADPSSAEARVRFNEAARHMARDCFFGVGLNNYPLVLGTTKYYYDVYPDLVDEWRPIGEETSRLGVCHHVYNLVMAETGYVGLVLFVLMLGWLGLPLLRPALAPRRPDGVPNVVAVGLLMGLATLHLQGLLEWALFQGEMLNLFFILGGLAEGVGRLDARPSAARRIPSDRPSTSGRSPGQNAPLLRRRPPARAAAGPAGPAGLAPSLMRSSRDPERTTKEASA